MARRIALIALVVLAVLLGYESLSRLDVEGHNEGNGPANSSNSDPFPQTTEKQNFTVNVDDVELGVLHLPEWVAYTTSDGIVLAERPSDPATEVRLDGLMAHVFVPSLDDLEPSTGEETVNTALAVLEAIVERPEYIGSAIVNKPTSFDWSGHDAAYYLLDSGDGQVTFVVGVRVPSTERLVVTSISAPTDKSGRIRQVLPHLLDDLTINGTILDGEAFTTLPDPLDFPRYDGSAKDSDRQP